MYTGVHSDVVWESGAYQKPQYFDPVQDFDLVMAASWFFFK